jgi:hypothetical protein
MVVNMEDSNPIALANEMHIVYDRLKDHEDSLWPLEDGGHYHKVFFGQIWISDIWNDVEEALESYGLWIETGEDDGADVYVCGNDTLHFCKNCKWMDKGEYELRLEVCRCYKPQNIIQRGNILKFDHCDKGSLACYYYVERTDDNANDYKDTLEFKAGCYL